MIAALVLVVVTAAIFTVAWIIGEIMTMVIMKDEDGKTD